MRPGNDERDRSVPESAVTMRRMLPVLLFLNGLLLTCVLAAFLLDPVNPMRQAFIIEFTVENRSESNVYVTPIGTVGPEGHRRPLPMELGKAAWAPASQRGRFPVRRGETITLYYDWDDINFSELVVETENGELRQLVVNPEPTLNQYIVPKVTDFVIDDLSRLEAVDHDVREAHAAAQQPASRWPIGVWTGVPALTFLALWWWYRRLTAAETVRKAAIPA